MVKEKVKILFVGLNYHNYTKSIISELEAKDYNIFFHEIKPRNFLAKLLQTISPYLFKKYLNFLHRKIFQKYKHTNFTYVFFLQVHYVSHHNMRYAKRLFKKSKFILYNWDSVTTHDYTNHIKYFDSCFTFDSDDSKKYNINYLPLFVDPFYYSFQNKAPFLNIYFVGNIVSERRYFALKKFVNFCKLNQIKFKFHMKISPLIFLKLIFKGHMPYMTTFFDISPNSYKKLLEESGTVFDVSNHLQSGYTMRLIENLYMNKKIMTSSKNVKDENFYSPDRIFIISDFEFNKSSILNFINHPLKKNTDFVNFKCDSFTESLFK